MADELDDYSGPFKADLRLEDFSEEALVTLCREFIATFEFAPVRKRGGSK